MTGQIADHFAQRKIVARDGFLEGTAYYFASHASASKVKMMMVTLTVIQSD